MNLHAIWKSDWFIGSALTLLFVIAFQQELTLLKSIENIVYDSSVTSTSQTGDKKIIILNINPESLPSTGLSSKQAITSAVEKLTDANASFIAIDSRFRNNKEIAQAPADRALVDIIYKSGNTLLPVYFDIDTSMQQSGTRLPKQLKPMALQHVNTSSPHQSSIATLTSHPDQQFTEVAAGLGHMSFLKDHDDIVRSEALTIAYGNEYLPSFSLLLASKILNIPLNDIRVHAGKEIELGSLTIGTDRQTHLYPSLPQAENDTYFQTYSFNQLYEGKIPATALEDKIILIEAYPDQTFQTPGKHAMTRIEFSAHVLQNILHSQAFQRPAWTHSIELVLLLIIGFYLAYALPQFTTRVGIAFSSLIFIALISVDFLALLYYSTWLQTITAAILLLIGHLFLICKQTYICEGSKKKSIKNMDETNKKLGISFQNQGMLEQAFEKFQACPVNDDMLSTFDKLALALERKQQFTLATAVYEHIARNKPNYPNIQARISSAKSEGESSHINNSTLSTTLIPAENKRTLGRYEIISELGKGAMGTVYLGKDPKINRKVAIKTMALSEDFEPDEVEEVKSKFFHEAEIAGMLNHPNIVTIFDAGDEQNLAYIAMEFLDGIDLSPYTRKGRLLPFSTTLKIVGKVAEALQYAHEHDVIHRDIKPANIMILKNKTVKVTDFGIAHIIDSSKTKAGIVLGTPSYMSPEQLSGKKLDGRSDLFSLGVMLYELTSGIRPFRAESLSKLMYKIAKQPHVDIREHNTEVPDCIRLLIDELLTKQADQRINTANDLLGKVSLCLRDLNSNGESQ